MNAECMDITTESPKQVVLTLEQAIQKIKGEIMDDVRAGVVPASVESFGDLHDYVDANCYGGFCVEEYADALTEHFGGRDENEGMPDGMLAYINAAQNAVSVWIKEGGIEREYAEGDARDLRPSNGAEQ